MLHTRPHTAPTRDNNNKGRCFYPPFFGEEDQCTGIGSRNKALKAPMLSMMPTMQVFVEDAMYVSQGKILMSGGDAAY